MEHTIRRHALVNGAELLVVNMQQAVSFYLGCYMRGGFRYTPDDSRELSHLLEHLMFEGNRQIADPLKFKQEVEKYGAAWNAGTSLDLVGYYYVGGRDDLTRLTDLALNQVYFPTFTPEQVKQQQGVITRELARYAENDNAIISYRTTAILTGENWWPDTKLRTKQLQAATYKDLMRFHAEHYTAANSRWVFVGALSPKEEADLIKQLNGVLKEVPAGKKLELIRPELQKFNNLIQGSPATRPDQAVFMVRYILPGYRKQDRAARKIIATILSGGMGSRLWTKAREAGLTYHISASSSTNEKYSVLSISSQTTNSDVPALIKLTFDELVDVAAGKFTAAEQERAVLFIIGSIQRNYQVPVEYANWYADDYVIDKTLDSPEGWIEELKAVTLGDIQRVAAEYVRRDNGLLTYIGNKVDDSGFRAQMDRIPE